MEYYLVIKRTKLRNYMDEAQKHTVSKRSLEMKVHAIGFYLYKV